MRFLVSDGLDALLDVLEAGHASLHPICLSIVSDILENPKVPHAPHVPTPSTAEGGSALFSQKHSFGKKF